MKMQALTIFLITKSIAISIPNKRLLIKYPMVSITKMKSPNPMFTTQKEIAKKISIVLGKKLKTILGLGELVVVSVFPDMKNPKAIQVVKQVITKARIEFGVAQHLASPSAMTRIIVPFPIESSMMIPLVVIVKVATKKMKMGSV